MNALINYDRALRGDDWRNKVFSAPRAHILRIYYVCVYSTLQCATSLSGNELKFPPRPHAHIYVRAFSHRETKQSSLQVQIANKFVLFFFFIQESPSRMQQQSGQGNGNARRTLSPGPGGSSSEDSDISLGGTSPPSPSSSPPPNHQPSPVPLGSLGPLPPPSLNFRFDPTQPHFRFSHTTAFKFPPTNFRFGPHSPQPNHPNMPGGGIFRFTESGPFQAVGPRGDPTSRENAVLSLFYYRLPDSLGLPPPRLHPHEGLLHHPHPQHQLSEGISRISETSRLSDGGLSRLSDSLSEAHSPPLMAANLSVTGPLRVAVPSPHTPSSRGSPPPRQPTPQGQSQGQGLIRVATPPLPNPRPIIHRPFSPA
ncbi:hypothetical protein ACFW04_001977 [Cataglyphis niger]